MKKLNKEQVKQWLMDNCYDESLGQIDLSDLDFGDNAVNLAGIKGYRICNTGQEAEEEIFNSGQIGRLISNDFQNANTITNNDQEAGTIENKHQSAYETYF